MAHYMLALRILLTFLILTALLPGWGPLNVSNAYEEAPLVSNDELVSSLAFDR